MLRDVLVVSAACSLWLLIIWSSTDQLEFADGGMKKYKSSGQSGGGNVDPLMQYIMDSQQNQPSGPPLICNCTVDNSPRAKLVRIKTKRPISSVMKGLMKPKQSGYTIQDMDQSNLKTKIIKRPVTGWKR